MAGRIYSITKAATAVTAVQDLCSILATLGMAFRVHEVVISQTGQTTVGNLNFSLKRLPATVTVGSGGTAVTPQKMNNGDASATVTARCNDTTQATTSGTVSVLRAEAWNPINGYQYMPYPDDQPIIAPSQGFVVSLDSAPASSISLSITVVVEEIM
jgi:hypothetical protein